MLVLCMDPLRVIHKDYRGDGKAFGFNQRGNGLKKFFFLKKECPNPNSEGFSGGSDGKESANPGSIPGLGRSPGEGHGNPLQYLCLENPMDRGTWWATVHKVAQGWTRLK